MFLNTNRHDTYDKLHNIDILNHILYKYGVKRISDNKMFYGLLFKDVVEVKYRTSHDNKALHSREYATHMYTYDVYPIVNANNELLFINKGVLQNNDLSMQFCNNAFLSVYFGYVENIDYVINEILKQYPL